MRAPHSLPAGFFLFFCPRLLSFRPRDIDELTRGTTASQRPASASAAARGRCVGERRPGATRVVCRRPPGQRPRGAGGEKPAGRSLPPPPLVPRRRLGLLLRAPERAPTQAHPTSDEQTAVAARETDRACSLRDTDSRSTGGRRDDPRARRARTRTSLLPAPDGTPAVGIPRARSHPALASSIIGRARILASSYQTSKRDSCCKKEERLAPLHFLAPWYTPSNRFSGERQEHCSTLRTNR